MNNFEWKVIITILNPVKTRETFEAPFAKKLNNSG